MKLTKTSGLYPFYNLRHVNRYNKRFWHDDWYRNNNDWDGDDFYDEWDDDWSHDRRRNRKRH